MAAHSLGPTCAYHEDDSTQVAEGSGPPKVKAQFFYISSVPIDDPLSPVPPVASEKAASKHPPQPFSTRDNAALEEAWQGFQEKNEQPRQSRSQERAKPLREIFSFPKFKSSLRSPRPLSPAVETSLEVHENDNSTQPRDNALPESYQKLKDIQKDDPRPSKIKPGLDQAETGSTNRSIETKVMLSQDAEKATTSTDLVSAKEIEHEALESKPQPRRHFSPFRHRDKRDKASRDASPSTDSISTDAGGVKIASPTANASSSISGRPFARAPSGRKITLDAVDGANDADGSAERSEELSSPTRSHLHNVVHPHQKYDSKVFVPVGVSRLHLVEMPDLVMKPIYWSPINDKSSVIRATWFYKESMMPTPAEVANRLEEGYEDMKPFSDSYQDELNACVENGAMAELKVVHKLWPDEMTSSRPGSAQASKPELGSSDNLNQPDDAAKIGSQENAAADPRKQKTEKMYETWSVIYVDGKDAQLLKPNLLPSESRNRRPLNSIRKGRQIGVAVVRGFDRKAWLTLHPDPKIDTKIAQATLGAFMSQSGDATTRQRRMSCVPCDNERKSPAVSDLVLVIHGIGQKLSERVDSFNFTHAINGLRRDFNVELAAEAVKGNLRRDTGVMVLPVNWRLTVSFDDDDKAKKTEAQNAYHLTDITPDTLPAVRSLISDVMLDIPYYLSHHKPKMISAVVKEANRVYRLWCRNNPGFQENGRVHLVAHSLGSAMALDILSQQPTKVPENIDLTTKKASDKIFEFNTTNLFCCGSPSGFFLLLNNANLIPRKGRNKPGMETEDKGPGIAGETGTYGCLAVDNVYNILHQHDPIAYQLNATVDSSYAASLVPAKVPSANLGFLSRISNSLRLTSSSGSSTYDKTAIAQRPAMQSMPSTVEMSTHNFTREEIAEKRMLLLNDNGQIDYILSSAGGPLDFQYLDMLGAHSSYWILQDFARFLVVEIGRKPGREGTLPALRAQKKREYKKGSIA